jgi:hypothetical protein
MVIVASIYLRFYIDIGVGTFLPTLTPTPPKIPYDPDSTALSLNRFVIGKDLFLCSSCSRVQFKLAGQPVAHKDSEPYNLKTSSWSLRTINVKCVLYYNILKRLFFT